MTALAAFFALIPGALAIEQGSEANAPLARAILGGLLAGEPATLFVLPVIYSLIVKDSPKQKAERAARQQSADSSHARSVRPTPAGTKTRKATAPSRPCSRPQLTFGLKRGESYRWSSRLRQAPDHH